MIEEMLKSQSKLVARKQLYYALSQMFFAQVQFYKANMGAVRIMPDEIPDDVKKQIVVNAFEALAPLYRMSVALKSYRDAFGEYPEFAKFLELNLTHEARIDGLASTLEKIVISAAEMERDYTKTKGMEKLFRKHGFGEDFVKQCNEVKLKGEL